MSAPIALPLQQHPIFAAALARLGRKVERLSLTGAAPVQIVRRYGLCLASRGPVWTACHDHKARAETLRQSGLHIINAEHPCPSLRAAGYRQIHTGASMAELSLLGSPADRLARAHGKWRNSYTKAVQSGLTIKTAQFDARNHDWLLRADREQQHRKGFSALPHAILHAIAAVRPQEVVIVFAANGAAPVAGMLFVRHPPVATYHVGWTSVPGRQAAAHQLLLVHAANMFAKQRLMRLDLGQIDTENAPGLARFKIGSGAVVRRLGGTWLKIPGL
ncbi:GNAT family N-acetyltransferase [Yoonia sp. SS1-5]|uniref:GNAT family N-acetyltransferase n=1 Tax=Yoonia rhodophyticola TaxID=3137370 RepID=A0AAN0NL97_9RHOB